MGSEIVAIFNDVRFIENFKKDLLFLLKSEYDLIIFLPSTDRKLVGLMRNEFLFKYYNLNKNDFAPIDDIKSIFRLSVDIKKINPRLILSFTTKPNIIGGLVGKFANVPVVATMSGAGRYFHYNNFTRTFLDFSYKISTFNKKNHVIFENKYLFDYYSRNVVKRSLINGSGVDLDYFKTNSIYTNKNSNLLYVGRIMREKGIYELLEAFTILRKSKNHLKLTLTLVGEISLSDINLQNIIKSDKNIQHYGYVDDIRHFISNCSVLVHPTYHEGLSNVLLEASAMSRPVLASNIPGCREIVLDGVTGYLFESKSVNSLILAIEKFLSLSYQTRLKMGISARYRVEKIFDRKLVNLEFMRIVSTMIAR